MSKLHLITGGAGLLGSHIAEALAKRNEPVRALVRPTSDTSFLKGLDVELAIGDFCDAAFVRSALDGVDIVYHCAAHVGDWGPWRKFHEANVLTTQNLLEACRRAGHPRFVHVSSISVYGKLRPGNGEITEETAIGEHHWLWDYYGRSKVLAEEQVRRYQNHVIVRPSWIYGPRDRVSFPRLIESLRSGRFRIIGPGSNKLNLVHAADAARGILAAGELAAASGKVYHLCSPGEITQREFIDLFCARLALTGVKQWVPLPAAWGAGFIAEAAYRLLGKPEPPPVTRRAVYLFGRGTQFSNAKAGWELGWHSEIPIRDGLEQALAWQLARSREA